MLDLYKKLALGRSEFTPSNQIKKFIVESKFYDMEEEDLKTAQQLLLFDTQFQRSYLISTNKRLYLIVDDLRKLRPHLNWSADKNELIKDGRIPIEVEDKSEKSGILNIGNKLTNWLFSRDLFQDKSVNESLEELLGIRHG